MVNCGLYYISVRIVAMIVTQISWIILIIFKPLNILTNDLAYLGHDSSYDRSTVIVQATASARLLMPFTFMALNCHAFVQIGVSLICNTKNDV